MLDTDHFHDILFELSNQDRYKILQTLRTENYNVTNIAKHISITTQEASRHLTRLAETNLIVKTVSGDYKITGYGDLILNQISGTLFVTSNREYFTDHRVGELQGRFTSCLNDLSESRLVTDVMVTFANIERIIPEANEYIWRLTDRYNMMSLHKLEEATERGVSFRLMQTKHFQYPPGWPGPGIVLRDARLSGRFEVRTSPEANVFIAMNEKEVAILAFPMEKNVFDYRGFTSKDPRFHEWCREVFSHYWGPAEPVN
jgi:predicted transcriptional regulator